MDTQTIVAFGTLGMALAILWLQIIKPWWKKPKIKMEFEQEEPYCKNVIGLFKEDIGEDLTSNDNSNESENAALDRETTTHSGDMITWDNIPPSGGALLSSVVSPQVVISEHETQHSKRILEIPGYWIRVKIKNKGMSIARNCEGRLVEISRVENGGEKRIKKFVPLILRWASRPYITPIDINRKSSWFLDIVFINKEDERMKEEFSNYVHICDIFRPVPTGTMKDLEPGEYYLKVTVYGENFNPKTEKFYMNWFGNWNEKGENSIIFERVDSNNKRVFQNGISICGGVFIWLRLNKLPKLERFMKKITQYILKQFENN